MDYSAFARWCGNVAEELVDTLSEEAVEALRREAAGATLQSILLHSSSSDVFDYISHTSAQRATIKRFGPQERRNRLALEALLHMQAVLGGLEVLEHLSPDMRNEDLLYEMFRLRVQFVSPKLKSPTLCREEGYQSLRDALRGLGLS